MIKKRKPECSESLRNVRVTPEFRENPDMEKLARALIAVANMLTEKKTAEDAHGKGDTVP